MKNIYLTADHESFRDSVRTFLEKEVAPHADKWEADRKIPREAWLKLGAMGFLGLPFPEELGGAGTDIFYSMIFLEELARSRMGGYCAAVGVQQFIATGSIFHQGTPAQKEKYIRPCVEGKAISAISISEPDTGSDVAALRTTAVRDGDHWVINGAKTWITNGVYADFYVLACKTDREAGPGGISLILADAGTKGMTTRKLDKIGWHTSDTAELALENVRVPLTNLIGEENMGFYYIMQTFVMERLTVAAISTGAATLAIEDTLKYMDERQAFGKPIAKFQALRHRMADLITELEAAKLLVYHAAWLHSQGKHAVRESSMAKLMATELSNKVHETCLQFHGGFGYVEEYPIARAFRDARVGTIVAGTSEIMREIIAKTDIDKIEFEAPKAGEAKPSAPAEAGELAALMRSLETRIKPDKTADWKAVFHFTFKDSKTPQWTVTIDHGRCKVQEGHQGSADCTLTTTEGLYLDLEKGRKSPQMAVITGKLKISDLGLMTRFTKAFKKHGTP